jgi:acyl-coenzyme A thioesterase PaaI-like protein
MDRTVVGAQNVSRMCMVCGRDNPLSLKARFYDLEGAELLGVFDVRDEHQSYPGRVHGGVVTAMLDETIGRALAVGDPTAFGVTVELKVRFKKPVPIGPGLRVLARVTTDPGKRLYEGTGEIVLDDGTVAAEAWGRYMKMPIDKIADGDFATEWFADERERPDEIVLPG